jgi:hypothetical protein
MENMVFGQSQNTFASTNDQKGKSRRTKFAWQTVRQYMELLEVLLGAENGCQGPRIESIDENRGNHNGSKDSCNSNDGAIVLFAAGGIKRGGKPGIGNKLVAFEGANSADPSNPNAPAAAAGTALNTQSNESGLRLACTPGPSKMKATMLGSHSAHPGNNAGNSANSLLSTATSSSLSSASLLLQLLSKSAAASIVAENESAQTARSRSANAANSITAMLSRTEEDLLDKISMVLSPQDRLPQVDNDMQCLATGVRLLCDHGIDLKEDDYNPKELMINTPDVWQASFPYLTQDNLLFRSNRGGFGGGGGKLKALVNEIMMPRNHDSKFRIHFISI